MLRCKVSALLWPSSQSRKEKTVASPTRSSWQIIIRLISFYGTTLFIFYFWKRPYNVFQTAKIDKSWVNKGRKKLLSACHPDDKNPGSHAPMPWTSRAHENVHSWVKRSSFLSSAELFSSFSTADSCYKIHINIIWFYFNREEIYAAAARQRKQSGECKLALITFIVPSGAAYHNISRQYYITICFHKWGSWII